MKLRHVATLLAIVFSSSLDSSFDAECTAKELAQFQMISEQLSGSIECSAFRGEANPANAFTKTLCSDAKCLAVIKEAISQYPDCTVQEISTKAALQFGTNVCENLDVKLDFTLTPSAAISHSDNSTTTSPTPTSISSGNDTSEQTPSPTAMPTTLVPAATSGANLMARLSVAALVLVISSLAAMVSA